MERHFLRFLLKKIAMRIDCSPEGAVNIRDDLRHCYVLIFFIFGTGVFFGAGIFFFFFLLFILI